ncbi:Fur-regulated basic protein FbpA [Sutcliffiella horikoshii]|uniref:Fur-regulated basic protein FbpA n=1 Tax=Sutcliffiella horikoshii TaxID=79883 RepID=A0A5D4SCI5_9BACI|nr:Fur-regulated basic protein FbpA [Sutcliffiella horikoshii]TYS59532.1 Fur-regulated basic protein FbpA [Sutcliffiella horikoshii]
MSTMLSQAIQHRREFIIDQLLNIGVYKTKNAQLYELCLCDLEREYRFFKRKEENK